MEHHAILVRLAKPAEYLFEETETDVVRRHFERLGVDEVRQLQQQAYLAPRNMTMQTLVISALQITVEAQNALLKILEEPPKTTRFIFALPPGVQLLLTLQSRFSVSEATEELVDSQVWDSFVSVSIKERLAQIDQWHKKKDAEWLLAMQAGLRAWLQQSTPSASLCLVAERLGTRGASNKILLEMLALDEQLQK